ncbi:MAG: zinc ribbon domain-containing protein [Chloroflexi bacterium]|nr:MAG: zinc ribbon domain-containing protein [Chloroflexota bacterium]
MPVYEYYCEACDGIFEALRSVRQSEESAPCPKCGTDADRIMPTTFASMSRKDGWRQRVPYHHKPVRAGTPAKTIARVKPKENAKRKGKAEGATG